MSTAAAEQFDPTDPRCPECGGDMYDNRADNAKKTDGKRRPDFRCKDDREHVIWPPREKKGAGKGSAKASQEKGAYSIGRLPGVDEEGGPAAPAAASPLSPEAIKAAETARRDRICVNMKRSITYFGDKTQGMLKLMDDLDMGYTPETVQHLVTSLFIALNDSRIR